MGLLTHALRRNRVEDPAYECAFTAIEPHPYDWLDRGVAGITQLIRSPVQEVNLSEFEGLGHNDILFIDSSHVLKIGSDVCFEYLEVLPRLGRGVVVHIHDIFLPAQYPEDWLRESRFFWNEQYVLQAFLTHNNSFEVIWPGHYVHLMYPDELHKAFAKYIPSRMRPTSFWMVRR